MALSGLYWSRALDHPVVQIQQKAHAQGSPSEFGPCQTRQPMPISGVPRIILPFHVCTLRESQHILHASPNAYKIERMQLQTKVA